jgi:crotonobetainyl-CoA:carnitine CoA-transferase CaiB-like acyl-CoA transferase
MQGAIGITLTRLEKCVRKTCPWTDRIAMQFAAPVGAPLLGQHTEQVLREIGGLDADQIAALAAAGTIVCHPGR